MDRKIKVGMDISQLAHLGGVATYTNNISISLEKISDLDMAFFYSSFRKPYKGKLKNVKKYKLPPTLFELFFNRVRNISIEKFLGPLDVFHSSDWTQPKSKAKKVTTYHDVVPLKYPQWSDPQIIKVHKRRLQLVEMEIDMVIAVSESTKKDLLQISKIPEEKIKVIYEAPTADFSKYTQKQINEFKSKYNLPDKFILAIGGIGERRNLNRIKQAWKDYNLVITGETIPWIEDEELGLLYQSADVLAYCSFYEGFGLPILDAMCCGLPVITSNISSMPEVGGSAALYVDPLDLNDIKESIKNLMEDKDLRESMIKKGYAQASKFSWEKTANDTTEVYRELIT